jgi:hypothetical protein
MNMSEKKELYQIEPIIGRYNTWLLNKDDIKKYVEFPMQAACEIFWDKNIKTSASSANKTHLDKGSPAYIGLDFLSLSQENKKYAEQLVNKGKAKMVWNDTAVGLDIPLSKSHNTDELIQASIEVAKGFKNQAPNWVPVNTKHGEIYDEKSGVYYMSEAHKELIENYQQKDPHWVPHYTLEQLRRDQLTNEGRVANDFSNYNPEYDGVDYWLKEGFYFDPETNLFYLSENDCIKFKENNEILITQQNVLNSERNVL